MYDNKELEQKLFDLYQIAESENKITIMFKILEFLYKMKFKNKKDISIDDLTEDDLRTLINLAKDE